MLEDPAVASCAEEGHLGADRDERAGSGIQGDDAVAPALLDAQGGHEPLRIDPDPLGDGPLVEGVQQDVARDVGGITGPGVAGASEGALGDGAVLKAAEGASPVLHLVDDFDALLAHDLHGILVGQVVASLDGVEGVLLPGIVTALGVVGEGRVEASLGGNGVGPGRVDLGDQAHVEIVAKADRGPKTRQTTADDEDIVIDHVYENLT